MIVHLTPDQKTFVRDAIASGRLHGEEDAMREALAQWERRERARAEILASVDVAEAAEDALLDAQRNAAREWISVVALLAGGTAD